MRALEPSASAHDGAPRRSPVLRVATEALPKLAYHGWRRHVKRALDLIIGSALLLISAPVMFIVAVVVRRSSPGPAIFKQERVGEGGRTFQMWKFRTMYVASEDRLSADPALYETFIEHDFKIPTDEDPRVVPRVRVLRDTSLDELPQLVNVIAGSMSLVGPRPVEAQQISSYGDLDWAYLGARPGLTGSWQTNSQPPFPERAHLDAGYLERWSLRADLAILMKTIPIIVGSTRALLRSNGSTAAHAFDEPHRDGP